jgi:predicted dehydrogenase
MDRRSFLQTSTALLLSATGARGADFPTHTPRVGLIGSGWYGKVDLFRLIQVAPVEVSALCDVDSRMLSEAASLVAQRHASGSTPTTYSDYRRMLDEQELDIVIVATPDHWHALPAIDAMRAGADVYVEKPISVDVVEGQAMVAAARKYGRVVQVGTQRRSTPHLIEARERIILPGLLGRIGMVELFSYYHMRHRESAPDSPAPEHLDWEMYTGPAPMRPYNRVVHPRGWRNFMEYGNGIVGDMCIHMLDMVRWMLDLGWPTRVSSAGGILVHPESIANTTDTQTATFEFGELPVLWQHRTWGHPADSEYPWGAILYGENGTLKLSVMRYEFTPLGDGTPMRREVEFELDQYPEDRTERDLEHFAAPAVRRHMSDFLAAIASRGRPVADVGEGHISSASCILANISLQLGRTLTWDAEREQVVGDDEANRLLRRPYRAPWVHPEPDSV